MDKRFRNSINMKGNMGMDVDLRTLLVKFGRTVSIEDQHLTQSRRS
jgi:hypothetical protein